MKKKLLLLIIMCVRYSLHAQSISPFVISTSGGFYSNSAGMLSLTTGEMTAVQTYTASGSILTQGFQQPSDLGVGIVDNFPNNGISVFPNPTTGKLTIRVPENYNGVFVITVYDAIGNQLIHRELNLLAQANQLDLFLGQYHPGLYMLEFKTATNRSLIKITLLP